MSAVLRHLGALVACDTRNPPRQISADAPLFAYLRAQLADFEVQITDEGDGCVSFLASRGRPNTLVNVHLDTVPASPQWQRDPLLLSIEGERAYGLGACDIKGGAAAAISAAQQTDSDLALLFTTDEEYGDSTCVHRFVQRRPALLDAVDLVVVSEPTGGRAVLAHRGFARGEVRFESRAGHSSEPRALEENANHRLGRWLVDAVAEARRREDDGSLGLSGLRFNCGVVEGGTADNVIADRSTGVFSLRPPPGVDPAEAALSLGRLAGGQGAVLFEGPPLPAADAADRAAAAEGHARALGLEIAPPVDFWTEAALFSAAGWVTFVFGPGAIEQAHIADEWVEVEQLERAVEVFAALFDRAAS